MDEQRSADGIRHHEQALAQQPDNAEVLASLGKALLAVPGSHVRRLLPVL